MTIPVRCPHCESVLKLKDEAEDRLGQKMRCPKCQEVFVARRYRDEEEDEYEVLEDYEDDDVDDVPPSRRSRGASRERSSGRAQSQGKPNRSKSGKKTQNSNAVKKGLSAGGAALVVLLIVLKAILRTQSGAPQPAAPQTQTEAQMSVATANATVPSVAPTDDECLAFAKAFEADVEARKGQAFTAINFDALLSRSLDGLELNPGFVTGFKRGALASVSSGLSSQVTTAIGVNGSYRLLRIHTVGNEKRALFRMSGESGLNYHDFELNKTPSGQIEIVDMYVFITGEKFSETMRQLVILGAVSQKGAFLKRLTGQLGDFETHAPTIQTLNAQKASGQFQAALKTFKSLPVSLQKQKTFALMRVLLAGQVDPQEYLTAMSDYRQAFPNDASIDLMSVDFYMLRKEYDNAMAALDRVDQNVGGDSYLNVMRANVFSEQGRVEDALRVIEIAIQGEPGDANPLYTLVGLGLNAKNYDVVLDGLKRLRSKHDVQFNDLRSLPEYAGFVASPQFQEWLKITQ